MKSKIFIFLFAVLCVWIMFNRANEWKGAVITWDKCGYYIYLPAVFIYHDLTELNWYPVICEKYHPSADAIWHSIKEEPTGKRLNKYCAGVSCLELPFFLIAHEYTLLSGVAAPDGFSAPYQWWVIISCFFWVAVGLFFLRAFLRRFFSDTVVLYTLACVALGTNLYYYTVFDAGMSHPYSFMLYSALLYFTERWYRSFRLWDICFLGVVMGFIFITRPVNIIVGIIPLLWHVSNLQQARQRIALFIKTGKQLLAGIFTFLLVTMLQLIYWKAVTGHWFYDSYEDEGFNFLHPRFWPGLFSFRKGWFIYTPMALLAIAGLYFLSFKDKKWMPTLMLYLILAIYITFSWKNWWYGGGFGSRALIESLAILALPLAAFLEKVLTSRFFAKSIMLTIIVFIIALNMFQSYQFSLHIIHWDKMNRKSYVHSFFQTKYDAENEKYLMTDQESWKEDQRSFGNKD